MVVTRLGGVVALLLAAASSTAAPPEPVVSVWYRGSPAGQPRLDDLAAIRAVGFTGVTWPLAQSEHTTELRAMASTVGLSVIVRPPPRVTGADGIPVLDTYVDLAVSGALAGSIPARAWRAVAKGARVLSFDPGQKEGTGLTAPDGQTPAWVAPAVAIARQLSANTSLVERLRPGPPVTIGPPAPAGLEVVMLDGEESWIILATNLGTARQKAVASLLSGIPYGLWVSWLDGTDLSMLSTPNGPRWTFEIDAGKALVYITGKKQR